MGIDRIITNALVDLAKRDRPVGRSLQRERALMLSSPSPLPFGNARGAWQAMFNRHGVDSDFEAVKRPETALGATAQQPRYSVASGRANEQQGAIT